MASFPVGANFNGNRFFFHTREEFEAFERYARLERPCASIQYVYPSFSPFPAVDPDKTDAIGGTKKGGFTEVVTLLERFKSDAAKTRSEVRKELGING